MSTKKKTTREIVREEIEEYFKTHTLSRHGMHWDECEDEKLLEEIRQFCSETATAHGRSGGAIWWRIKHLIDEGHDI